MKHCAKCLRNWDVDGNQKCPYCNCGLMAGSAPAHGSVATRTIADSIAEYKATRGTAAVKLLHHVLGKLIGLKCNHCGKEVSVTIESPPNSDYTPTDSYNEKPPAKGR